MTQSDEYAFEWTIPQCVLTLRLIALTFDLYDGANLIKLKKSASTSSKQSPEEIIKNEDALTRLPTFLEYISHCFFPGAFLVGPQVPHRKYIEFTQKQQSFLPIR